MAFIPVVATINVLKLTVGLSRTHKPTVGNALTIGLHLPAKNGKPSLFSTLAVIIEEVI